MKKSSISEVLLATLFMAAASTIGDFIWAKWVPEHRMIFGLIHGALLMILMGLALGHFAGGKSLSVWGALGGLTIGLIASGGFYLLAPLILWNAMFVSWMGLWILFSLLFRSLSRQGENFWMALLRGGSAAVLSGIAFYAISGVWLNPTPGGPNYFSHFLNWSAAFFCGFAPLLLYRKVGAKVGGGNSPTS